MTSNTEVKPFPLKAKLAIIAACLFWAASFIATKAALPVIPPLTLVMFRLIVSSLCFIFWLLLKRTKLPSLASREWGLLFLLSLVGTGLHYGIQTIGLQYTSASNGSLYAVTCPITITILAALFLGERITWKKALGIGLALIGVLTVLGWETLKSFELKGRILGDLLVFASIFMWGVFTVMGKGITNKLGAVMVTTVVTVMGTLYMIPAGVVEMKSRLFSFGAVTGEAWAAVIFLGVFCSFLATFLYFYALEHTESQKVGVYLYTIPPMTYVIAALYLGETATWNLLVGSAVVLSGVYITEKG